MGLLSWSQNKSHTWIIIPNNGLDLLRVELRGLSGSAGGGAAVQFLAVLTNRQVPVGVLCSTAWGGSNEVITAWYITVKQRRQEKILGEVTFNPKCFKTVFFIKKQTNKQTKHCYTANTNWSDSSCDIQRWCS